MLTVITDQDRNYMNAFPIARKAKIIQEIMSRPPVEEDSLEGSNDYLKTILKLRADGMRLIDLQPQESAFTTVWYSRHRSLLGTVKAEIAALVVWEFDGDKDVTTLRVWHI
jgi:hypothetical protein